MLDFVKFCIFLAFRNITAEAAKEALQEYVSQQCCYGSDPAKEMSIKDIVSTSAFHVSRLIFRKMYHKEVKPYCWKRHACLTLIQQHVDWCTYRLFVLIAVSVGKLKISERL